MECVVISSNLRFPRKNAMFLKQRGCICGLLLSRLAWLLNRSIDSSYGKHGTLFAYFSPFPLLPLPRSSSADLCSPSFFLSRFISHFSALVRRVSSPWYYHPALRWSIDRSILSESPCMRPREIPGWRNDESGVQNWRISCLRALQSCSRGNK